MNTYADQVSYFEGSPPATEAGRSRAFYAASVAEFLTTATETIVGQLSIRHVANSRSARAPMTPLTVYKPSVTPGRCVTSTRFRSSS